MCLNSLHLQCSIYNGLVSLLKLSILFHKVLLNSLINILPGDRIPDIFNRSAQSCPDKVCGSKG